MKKSLSLILLIFLFLFTGCNKKTYKPSKFYDVSNVKEVTFFKDIKQKEEFNNCTKIDDSNQLVYLKNDSKKFIYNMDKDLIIEYNNDISSIKFIKVNDITSLYYVSKTVDNVSYSTIYNALGEEISSIESEDFYYRVLSSDILMTNYSYYRVNNDGTCKFICSDSPLKNILIEQNAKKIGDYYYQESNLNDNNYFMVLDSNLNVVNYFNFTNYNTYNAYVLNNGDLLFQGFYYNPDNYDIDDGYCKKIVTKVIDMKNNKEKTIEFNYVIKGIFNNINDNLDGLRFSKNVDNILLCVPIVRKKAYNELKYIQIDNKLNIITNNITDKSLHTYINNNDGYYIGIEALNQKYLYDNKLNLIGEITNNSGYNNFYIISKDRNVVYDYNLKPVVTLTDDYSVYGLCDKMIILNNKNDNQNYIYRDEIDSNETVISYYNNIIVTYNCSKKTNNYSIYNSNNELIGEFENDITIRAYNENNILVSCAEKFYLISK